MALKPHAGIGVLDAKRGAHQCAFCASIGEKRRRCFATGVPFNLTCEHIWKIVPSDMICPILNVKMLLRGEKGLWLHRASIDKIEPAAGYVVGNVAIISVGANLIKGSHVDPSIFRRMADWLEHEQCASKSETPEGSVTP